MRQPKCVGNLRGDREGVYLCPRSTHRSINYSEAKSRISTRIRGTIVTHYSGALVPSSLNKLSLPLVLRIDQRARLATASVGLLTDDCHIPVVEDRISKLEPGRHSVE